MSLIHWWPLNGDLQDKIQGKVLSTSTWTSSTEGKIGSCYNMNIGGIATCSNIYLPSTFTMTCWIKNNDLAYPQSPCAMKLSNGSPYKTTTADKGWEFCHGGTLSFTTNDGVAPKAKFLDYNPSSLIGTWYHLALVSDFINKVAYIYINGSLVQSATITSGDWGGTYTFTVGQLYGWKIDGLMNDLRLYDHALSAAEVKELSKALVIHYIFDDVCAEPTTNIILGINSASGKASLESGRVKINWSPSGGDSYIQFDYTENIKANSIYTLSFDCEGLKPGEVATFAVSNLSAAAYNIQLKNGRNILTFTAGSDLMNDINTYKRLFFDDRIQTNGAVFYLSNFQLEEKDHATPYTPTSRESMLHNETGLTQPNYKANLQLINDAGSGTYSLKCTGSTIINTPISGDVTSGATISCWIKTPTYPSTNGIVFADYNSKLAFGFYGTQNAIISCGGYSAPYVSNIKSRWVEGWNHVVVTRNNSGTISCYLNGVKLSTTSSNNWSSTSGYSTIGGRYNGSYQTYFTGYVDDYRVYHTLLSNTDIQNLYKTKAYITDKGDIETHQFIEGKTQAQVTSKYCFEADEFYEELYGGYDVLEYIESTGTQYVDTGYITTLTDYTYELDVAPTKIGGFYSYMGFMASGTTPRAGIHEYSNVFMLGANATTNSSIKPVVNERVVLKGHFKSGAQKLYKNNVQIASNTTTFNHSSNTLTTHIFGRNYSSGRNLSSIKLYDAKIYEGSTLIRHYIPARRQSDNALGLYELLNGTFHVNSGSGTFVSGSAITNKSASIYEDQHVSGRAIIEI